MVEKAKTYETYKKLSTLGTGSFGTAYLVECQSDKVTSKYVKNLQAKAVIKQIDIENMNE